MLSQSNFQLINFNKSHQNCNLTYFYYLLISKGHAKS